MTGVRAQQRALRRTAMLAAAAQLFERQGYERTTFDEIAAASRSGVSTVYKYFGDKESIVIALLDPSLEQSLHAGEGVIREPPPDAADAMVSLLSCYRDLGGPGWASREILRLTVFPGLGNEGPLSDFVRRVDAQVQDQISRLLRALRQRGRVTAALRIEVATGVIFALLNQHFGAFLTDGGYGFAAMFRRLERAVRIVFDDWRGPAGTRGRAAARPGRRRNRRGTARRA